MGELDNRIEELLRRTKITTKTRYRASERLKRHYRLSRWTISILTCTLIIIPLTQAFSVPITVSQELQYVWQTILAILVLVYSLHLGDENFDLRAYKMHQNGVELGRLARKLAGLDSANVKDNKYDQLASEYYAILEKYENHEPIDYQLTLLSEYPSEWKGWILFAFRFMKASLYRTFILSHYLFAVLAAIGVIYFLFV